MKTTTRLFSFVLTITLFGSLAAKRYHIPANQPGVACTIETLSKSDLEKLIGNFSIPTSMEYQTVPIGKIGSQKIELISKRPNLFIHVLKNYIAVTVCVENNTTIPITIYKDEYLAGLENFYVSKENLIDSLYGEFENIMNSGISQTTDEAIGCGLVAATSLFVGYLAYSNDPNFFNPFVIISSVIGGLCGLGTIGLGCTAYRGKQILEAANRKKQNLERQTYTTTKSSNKRRRISKRTDTYTIQPGSKLHDVFFVDLEKVSRSIFAEISPTLIVG